MTNEHLIADEGAQAAVPDVRRIGIGDLKDALAKGLDDFKTMPTHLLFLCLIYPIVIVVMARAFAGDKTMTLVFPLLAGYTLIGPLIATGMYELSRRRERGMDISRWHAFDPFKSMRIIPIIALGVVLMVFYVAWLAAAQAIFSLAFGNFVPDSPREFVELILTTSQGYTLIIVGSGVGLLFAVLVLTLSVVSFPMLLDRNVSVLTAIQTSIKAVIANPATMLVWGLIVAVTLFIGSVPVFVGLAIALPVLGHATWHLYRKVVVS